MTQIPKRIEALIFDMDGTMIDSMPYHAKSWQAFIEKHNLPMTGAEILATTTGRTGLECMYELLEPTLGKITEAQAKAFLFEKETLYRELFAPVFTEVQGFKKFSEMAKKLGFRLAGGTAGDIHNVEFALQHLAMTTPLETIVRGDEGLRGKPEPDIFLEGANRLGVTPENCIVFEDAPFGIEAARRAGMHAVAICSSHSAKELSGPHVLAAVMDYDALIDSDFLDQLRK